MNVLKYKSVEDLVCDIYYDYDEQEEYSFIGSYDLIIEIINYLIEDIGYNLAGAEIWPEEFNGYGGPYLLEVGDDGLYVERAVSDDGKYLMTDKVVFAEKEYCAGYMNTYGSAKVFAFEISDKEDDGRCVNLEVSKDGNSFNFCKCDDDGNKFEFSFLGSKDRADYLIGILKNVYNI